MARFADQTDQFRDRFIGVLSHDLRTPLGAVTADAALLALPDDNPQRRNWVVTRIMSSAQRMEGMIRDLLDVTRARLGGSMPLKRRSVDLKELCEEAMMEIRAGQVVSNLAGNAIQHGSGTPITLTAHGDGDSVTLAVHNGGRAGIFR
jgi:signal transduction histidine kinase